MSTAKVFKSGNSQAIRLPKEFQFDVSEVEIFKQGDDVVLRKKIVTGADLYNQLTAINLPEDFNESIDDLELQKRDF